ncbi:MAG: hypothetical protein NXI10_16550 [bacterium]|nr:hypothetical protein [bacterium]
MSEITTNWTRKEFKAYLMMYAANANFFESEEEKELIHQIVSDATYKEIHREFDGDNDYQSIQKILYNIDKFDYSKKDLSKLMADIQRVFNADGKVDTLERNMLLALKHLVD